jgi:hypothetical protein
MNFIKHILSTLISAGLGGARGRRRLAVCALSVAAAASLTYFQPRRAQAQQTPTILRGAAALEQLKQDRQYESLQAPLNFTLQKKTTLRDKFVASFQTRSHTSKKIFPRPAISLFDFAFIGEQR